MNIILLLILITLIGSVIPTMYAVYIQFRAKPENEAVKRMRRVMLSLHISTLIMLAYLAFLTWEGIIRLNFLGKWTDDLFLVTALLVFYANWYAFLEFRRFRLLANTKI